MEDDRDIAWRLQLEEFFTPEQIQLFNLSGRQRPERMAEMSQFLHDIFELDSGGNILSTQAEAPPVDTLPEVTRKRSVGETSTNPIVEDLINVSLETAQANNAQDKGDDRVRSGSCNTAGPGKHVQLPDTAPEATPMPSSEASASTAPTERHKENHPQEGIRASSTACSSIETHVEGQQLEGNGGAGSSCPTEIREQVQPQAGNGGAGGPCSAASCARRQPQAVSDGAGSSCPMEADDVIRAPAGGAGSLCPTERRRESQERDGGAGSSCPTVRRVENQQKDPHEEAGSASPRKGSEERQSHGRSQGSRGRRARGEARADDPNGASIDSRGLAEMAQRLQGCTTKMGPEDMRALQDAIDEENQMYLDLLRGDVRAMRYFNRAGQDRANRIRASQVRAMYSAGQFHHPSRQPMYFGNEVVLFEPDPPQQSPVAPESGSGATDRPVESQPEAAKSEPTQPRDVAFRPAAESETDFLPECPQRPNTPLHMLDSRHTSGANRMRRERLEQVMEIAAANVGVSQPASGGDPPSAGIPTEATLDDKQVADRSALIRATDQAKEISEPQIASEPSSREVRPEPQIASEPSSSEVRSEPQIASEPSSREVRSEPQIASEPSSREVRPEPQIASEPSSSEVSSEPQTTNRESQDLSSSEQHLNDQGQEPGISSRSAQTDRPLIDTELNNEGDRSRRVAREIISEFNRALDPLFSMTPSYPIPVSDGRSSDQTGLRQPETDRRDASSPPTMPRMVPDDVRFLNSLRELFRYVENPRTSGPLSRFTESELVLLRIRLFARRAELQATRAARELSSVGLDLISRTFRFMAGSLSTTGQQDAGRNSQSTPAGETAQSGSQGAANVQQESIQEDQSYDFLNDEISITNLIVLIERQIVDRRTRQVSSLTGNFLPPNRESSRDAQLAWQYQNIEAESAERRRFMLQEFGHPSQDMGAFMRFFWRRYVLQPSGLTPSQLNSLPTVQHSEAADQGGSSSSFQCSICLYEYKAGVEVRILPCGHRFHKECVDEWLQRTATCPVCRARIQPSQNQ